MKNYQKKSKIYARAMRSKSLEIRLKAAYLYSGAEYFFGSERYASTVSALIRDVLWPARASNAEHNPFDLLDMQMAEFCYRNSIDPKFYGRVRRAVQVLRLRFLDRSYKAPASREGECLQWTREYFTVIGARINRLAPKVGERYPVEKVLIRYCYFWIWNEARRLQVSRAVRSAAYYEKIEKGKRSRNADGESSKTIIAPSAKNETAMRNIKSSLRLLKRLPVLSESAYFSL